MLDTGKALDDEYLVPAEGQVALSVYTGPGLVIQKLHVLVAGIIIIISVLIFLLLLGLFVLAL